MRSLRIVLMLTFLACALPFAQASTIYLYVGNEFQVADNSGGAWATTSQYITGWFMVAAPLPANSPLISLTPLEWSLSDGVHTLDQTTPNVISFALNVATDGSANFIDWIFVAGEFGSGPNGAIGMTLGTTNFGAMRDVSAGIFPGPPSMASNSNAPGEWSSISTPEPGTMALSAAGGLLLLACFWKRRRQA